MTTNGIPDWVTYPEAEWATLSPAEAGLDPAKWDRFLAENKAKGSTWEGEVHEGNDWGTVITRGGYLIQTWGDGDYRFQSASLGKAFTWALVGLAVDEGRIRPDDLVHKTWTGEGELSHAHKHLDTGHHKTLAWRHLIGFKDKYEHRGGFPVTNGYFWKQRSSAQSVDEKDKSVPEWAHWTGDPFYDNYSHAEPGTVGIYSSGGLWRLSQALTVLWEKDLKQVLDEKLFGTMGIPPERWDWTPGRTIHESPNWYPHMPGYGDFLDPPYETGGNVVRGGPGWVVMSAKDLARFGLLVATGGIWKGERLISSDFLRGHGGGNRSLVAGESQHYTSIGKVTTDGVKYPLPEDLFVGLPA